MPLSFEHCTAQQLLKLNPERTVFILPLGGLENFGPHLRVGLQIAISENLATQVAEQIEKRQPEWTAVLLPSMPLCTQTISSGFGITVRAHVARDYLVDMVTSLAKQGYLYFATLALPATPQQITLAEDAFKRVRTRYWYKKPAKRPVLLPLVSGTIDPSTVRSAPLWPAPDQHGGARDTSIALAIEKDWVQSHALTLPQAFLTLSPMQQLRARISHKDSTPQGYWGEPAQATIEQGQVWLASQATTLTDLLEGALTAKRADTYAQKNLRSYYSIIPFNQSFAKSWGLAALIVFTWGIVFWVYAGFFGSL